MRVSVFAKIWMTWLVDVTPNALGAMCRVILLLGITMPNCMVVAITGNVEFGSLNLPRPSEGVYGTSIIAT